MIEILHEFMPLMKYITTPIQVNPFLKSKFDDNLKISKNRTIFKNYIKALQMAKKHAS